MDIKHFYVEAGKGDPIILLHGNGENCDYFKGQIDEFAKYYHVYAIDTRGMEKHQGVTNHLQSASLLLTFYAS